MGWPPCMNRTLRSPAETEGLQLARLLFATSIPACLLAAGRTFDLGEQRPAMRRENLALASTRLPNGPNGNVTAEVARKQIDGTWLWVIDQPSISV